MCNSLLVPLRGLENVPQSAPFVTDLCREPNATVTLLHVAEGEEPGGTARETVLKPAVDEMRDHGFDTSRLELDVIASDDPAGAIVDWADAYDLAVLGKTKPSARDILFGTVPERIVNTADVPIITGRHRDENVDAAEQLL